MTAHIMKIPKNRQSRLSDDIWIAAEAIARRFGMNNARDGMETAIRLYAQDLQKTDPRFADLWNEVLEEGVKDD